MPTEPPSLCPERVESKMWMLRLASFNYGAGVGLELEVNAAFAALRNAISAELRQGGDGSNDCPDEAVVDNHCPICNEFENECTCIEPLL